MLSIVLLALVSLVSAHFRVVYPPWRQDSLGNSNTSISQWKWPCAGIEPSMSQSRIDWPLDGGSVIFNGSHPWAITYVNLGLGSEVTTFNVSLVEGFNQTGPGVFCFPKIAMQASYNATDGMNASIQVIQISHSGQSLYNCADIKFSKDAKALGGDECKNATGVGAEELHSSGATGANGTKTGSGSSSSPSSFAPQGAGVPVAALLAAVGMGAVALGLL